MKNQSKKEHFLIRCNTVSFYLTTYDEHKHKAIDYFQSLLPLDTKQFDHAAWRYTTGFFLQFNTIFFRRNFHNV